MNELEANKIRNRAVGLAYRLCGNREDAEEIANDVIIGYLEYEKRNGKRSTQLLRHAIYDALAKRDGRYGSERCKFKRLERAAESLDADPVDEAPLSERLGSLQYAPGESAGNGEKSRIDEECLERALAGAQQTPKRALIYIWEHYKKHGIQDDLEVEWITL
jgi:DNA-directed RNA polymerase specialized sigma24 family protein